MPALNMKQKDFLLRDIVIDHQVMPEFDFSNFGPKGDCPWRTDAAA